MKKIIILIIAVLFIVPASFGQTGSLEGKISDGHTEEDLMFVEITLYEVDSSTKIRSTNTDLNGNYSLNNIPIGKYDIEINYVGYRSKRIVKVEITTGVVYRLNQKLTDGVCHCAIHYPTITTMKKPLISFDTFTRGWIYSSEEIRNF